MGPYKTLMWSEQELCKERHAEDSKPLCDGKHTGGKYISYEARHKELCKTLRVTTHGPLSILLHANSMFKTQKTVCKHLMEEPYIFRVVEDPAKATKVSPPMNQFSRR